MSLVRKQLDQPVSLIGFCGGAWTVASYMIEGGSSDRKRALAVAARGEAWFGDLMKKVIDVSVDYLCRQVEAGAEALQIFDSWAGDVPAELRESVVFAPSRKIIDGVRARQPHLPVILFARGLGHDHVDAARYCAPNAVGVEQGVSLSELSARLGDKIAVQGNLEPEKLLAGETEFRAAVQAVLEDAPKGRHIFNLGHGILPSVAPARVTELVRLIREHDGV